jgi:Holliday junction resolvase
MYKTDKNQKEIVEALREIGCSVYVTASVGHDFPDLVVGTPYKVPDWVKLNGTVVLMEIKTDTGKLSEGQEKFISEFKGACIVVRNIEDALRAVGKEIL